jgi:hypothetical protein
VGLAAALFVLGGFDGQGRHRFGLAVFVERDERQIRVAGQPALSRRGALREHLDFYFERGRERTGHARLEDDDVADLDRMEKLEAVDTGGEGEGVGVPMAGDGAGDVNHVHHRSAQDVAERVGIVRQDDLRRLGRRLPPGLQWHRSQESGVRGQGSGVSRT